jgi:hypothetical protein
VGRDDGTRGIHLGRMQQSAVDRQLHHKIIGRGGQR